MIYFARGCADALDIVAGAGADAYGLDWRDRLGRSWASLGDQVAVQGNLDPLLLMAGSENLEIEAQRILNAFVGRPHVFNLGHGIGQFTPIAHVERLLACVRGWVA